MSQNTSLIDGLKKDISLKMIKMIKAIESFNPQKSQQKYFGDGKTTERIIKTLIKYE